MLKSLALALPPIRRLHESRARIMAERDMLVARLGAAETGTGGAGSPFWHFHASFDAIGTIRRHALPDPQPDPRFLTNFLGVRIDPAFFPAILDGKAGTVEGPPIPANWHADIAEWAAGLRAVDLARGRFRIIELGCGWGCWLNNLGAAARRAGLDVRLIGVEGDAGHVAFARQAFATNGFTSAQATLHHAIAGAGEGVALFPRQEMSGVSWGLEPILEPTEAQRAAAARDGRYEELPVLSLPALAAAEGGVDVVHIDIQGGEADLLAASIEALRNLAAYVVVGSHSRSIEGRLFDTMSRAGWVLEIERPAILQIGAEGPVIVTDGVQGWRNPVLRP